MSRTINSKPTACTLLALLGALALALALSGCGNLGKFDEAAVTRQAEQYYAEKYGTSAQVVDVWEDRSYSLFAYYSLDRAFCTMDDGSTVLVDFEQGVLGDNRQQDEIAAAYEQRFREELAVGRKRLEDAGYTVSLVLISGSSPADDGFLADTISIQEWQRNDEAEPETGSFFLARYTGDDRFFEEEASRVSLGTPRIEIEVSGPDADYANAFPTNVPEKPAWADPVEETCRALLPLTDGKPTAEVFVYQSGYRDRAVADDAECGKLGELSPYGKTGDVGSWLIVDWVDLGKGVHITSNEPGVRCWRKPTAPAPSTSSRRAEASTGSRAAASPPPPSRRTASRLRRDSSRRCRPTCGARDGSASKSPTTTRTPTQACKILTPPGSSGPPFT